MVGEELDLLSGKVGKTSTEALHISPQWQSAHNETGPPREVMRLPTVTGSVQVRDR